MENTRRNPSLSTQHVNRRTRNVNITSRGSEDSLSNNLAAVSRRSKSRSPSRSSARSDPFAALNAKISAGTRSLKSTSSSSVKASTSSHAPEPLDAVQRPNSTGVSFQKGNSSRPTTPAAGTSNLQKKDKGKDRPSKSHGSTEATFSGPLAAAEFERMRKEIEMLKNNLAEQKKQAKKQAKKIEEMKVEVASGKETRDAQEEQLQTLKSKHSRTEELLNTIETYLTCNICMEILNKPFMLSPCGHTFCLRDLQEWFRKAPPTDDDMDVDTEDPEYIKYRQKSCPACRAVVAGRPLPVFLARDVISALKSRATGDVSSTRRSSSPYVSEDPWDALFPNESEHEGDEDEDEDEDIGFGVLYSDSDSEMDVHDDVTEYDTDGEPFYREEDLSVVDEEEEEEEGGGVSDDGGVEEEYSDEENGLVYVPQQWEPPFYRESDIPAAQNDNQLLLLRRGCPPWLSSKYRMKYNHARGLIAHLNSLDPAEIGVPLRGNTSRMHRLFLGWNISDSDFSEYSGRTFMRQTLEDYKSCPHRFSVVERPNGFLDIHVLVDAEIVGLGYNTTDSDLYF